MKLKPKMEVLTWTPSPERSNTAEERVVLKEKKKKKKREKSLPFFLFFFTSPLRTTCRIMKPEPLPGNQTEPF
jgi:hypothetical protein